MKKYNSKYYNSPIKVDDIGGEIIVTITTNNKKEVIYSWYDKVNKCSYSPYINKSLIGIFLHSIPKKVLVLGVGAGGSIKFLQDHIKNIEITGVEIDESMVLISKEIMEIPQKNIIIKDAFLALDDLKENYFDSILIDCYGVDSKIPGKLMSFEFFKKCKKVLKKNGIITVNMANFELEKNDYEAMHQNLKQNFGEFFSLFLSGKNDVSNVVGVYNLDKSYKASDFTKSFLKHVENNEILNDFEILKNTFVDEKKIYLN